MTQPQKKFLISGAGIVGLLTAQALKARNIDFEIFERDANAEFREASGWAITIHWAMETLLDLIPEELQKEIFDAQVRRDFHGDDTGNFKYIDASNGETIVSIPPSHRLRVRREQIRRTLLKGIDVQWDCKLLEIKETDTGVKVTCGNGKVFEGDVLLGCDGLNSATRKILCGDEGKLYQLPLRFCGAKVPMTGAEQQAISERFDPLLFQGTVPTNETFFWFSMLSTPDYTGEEDLYYAQVNLSWKYPEDEPFGTPQEKAEALLEHAKGLDPQLHMLVERACEDPEQLLELKLADWPVVEWDTQNGRVLLLGDAAHAMTMYRGEACNHGITDVSEFMKDLDQYGQGEKNWDEVVKSYCGAVKERTGEAVILSRQACLDAHDMSKLYPNLSSPLLGLRKRMNTKEADEKPESGAK